MTYWKPTNRQRRNLKRMDQQIFEKQRKDPKYLHYSDEELMFEVKLNRHKFFTRENKTE